MSKPRTPEHFPRMKVRGGRRRRDAELTRYWRAVHTIDWATIGIRVKAAFDGFATALNHVGAQLARMQEVYRLRSWVATHQRHNAWVATHQLPATPSPYAAPAEQ